MKRNVVVMAAIALATLAHAGRSHAGARPTRSGRELAGGVYSARKENAAMVSDLSGTTDRRGKV
jgi:hypothetical protein